MNGSGESGQNAADRADRDDEREEQQQHRFEAHVLTDLDQEKREQRQADQRTHLDERAAERRAELQGRDRDCAADQDDHRQVDVVRLQRGRLRLGHRARRQSPEARWEDRRA